MEQEKAKTWAQREDDRRAQSQQGGNADSDQNERAKGRNLPEEQRDKERESGPKPVSLTLLLPHLPVDPEGAFLHGERDVPRLSVFGA